MSTFSLFSRCVHEKDVAGSKAEPLLVRGVGTKLS